MGTSDDARERYLAVYGAMVALMVHKRMGQGLVPDKQQMRDIVRAAHAAAKYSEEAQP
jgi:hypothetical protein